MWANPNPNPYPNPHQVSEAEGRQWAAGRGLAYFETSAKDGNNVTPIFQP